MEQDTHEEPDVQRPYEPPEIEVVGTVEEVTLMGVEGNVSDGGFTVVSGL
jgi:hypothetical protein